MFTSQARSHYEIFEATALIPPQIRYNAPRFPLFPHISTPISLFCFAALWRSGYGAYFASLLTEEPDMTTLIHPNTLLAIGY